MFKIIIKEISINEAWRSKFPRIAEDIWGVEVKLSNFWNLEFLISMIVP